MHKYLHCFIIVYCQIDLHYFLQGKIKQCISIDISNNNINVTEVSKVVMYYNQCRDGSLRHTTIKISPVILIKSHRGT